MSNERDPKVSMLPPVEQDQLAAFVAAFRRSMQQRIELQQLFAKLRRVSYEAHLKEGFTEAQALELCKNV